MDRLTWEVPKLCLDFQIKVGMDTRKMLEDAHQPCHSLRADLSCFLCFTQGNRRRLHAGYHVTQQPESEQVACALHPVYF